MRPTLSKLAVTSVLATAASIASAQPASGIDYGHPTYPNTPSSAWQHHASTVQEGYLRGLSNAIDAMGNYELSHTQAMILSQVAESLALDNEVKRVEACYQRQYALQNGRDQLRAAKEARREAGRLRKAFRESGILADTYQLSPSELDASTGDVAWPAILDHGNYAEHRATIERHLANIANDSQGDTSHDRLELARACKDFKDDVRDDYRASSQYRTRAGVDKHTELQKFLTGVRYAGVRMAVEQELARNGQPPATLFAAGN